jgi:hypothetical protein
MPKLKVKLLCSVTSTAFSSTAEAKEAASSTRAAPTTDRRIRRVPPMCPVYPIEDDSSEVLPMLRELFSRRPETRCLEAWELQHVLYTLNYTDGLADEAVISEAVEVALTDWTPDEGTA